MRPKGVIGHENGYISTMAGKRLKVASSQTREDALASHAKPSRLSTQTTDKLERHHERIGEWVEHFSKTAEKLFFNSLREKNKEKIKTGFEFLENEYNSFNNEIDENSRKLLYDILDVDRDVAESRVWRIADAAKSYVDRDFYGIRIILRDYINSDYTDSNQDDEIDRRIAYLNGLILRQPGIQLSKDLLFSIFPTLSELPNPKEAGGAVRSLATAPPPLPETAPETYQGLRGPEKPPAFVKRVYGEWLGQGLTRAHIRKLDPKLAAAINNWLSQPGNEWPADVDLPTLKEQNTRIIEELTSSRPGDSPREVVGDFSMREAERLRSAMRRREK